MLGFKAYLFLFAIVVIGIFFKVYSDPHLSVKQLSYRKISDLLTSAEHSFFLVLKQLVGRKYEVFCKVRVADILTPEKGFSPGNWQIAFNKISSKHFDFVLCKKNSGSVVCVIELDDKSHKLPKQVVRDKFLEHACLSAGLDLYRIPVRASYSVQSLREQFSMQRSRDENNN